MLTHMDFNTEIPKWPLPQCQLLDVSALFEFQEDPAATLRPWESDVLILVFRAKM